MFQSTPVIANGRITPSAASPAACRSSFNPRPLLLTGESFYGKDGKFAGIEFQSTPVIANGRIREWVKPEGDGDGVSIHARYC